MPVLGLGLAAACVVVAFVFGFWRGRESAAPEDRLAHARKYLHEVEALFPNQVQAIVFDKEGTHLVLADRPDVPASPALYLKICAPSECRQFITFSGQQIKVNGEACDVLLSHGGEVLLVGRRMVWSSSDPLGKHSGYRIEAKTLEATL
jgi:hypothetical protein